MILNDEYRATIAFYGKKLCISVLLAMVALFSSSCKTKAIPVVDTHNRDSVHIILRHDSIYTDRFHTEYIYGDTVWRRDSIYVYVGKSIATHDTLRLIDTLHSEPVVIEQPISRGKTFLIRSGIALWVILSLAIIAFIIGIIIKFAR